MKPVALISLALFSTVFASPAHLHRRQETSSAANSSVTANPAGSNVYRSNCGPFVTEIDRTATVHITKSVNGHWYVSAKLFVF